MNPAQTKNLASCQVSRISNKAAALPEWRNQLLLLESQFASPFTESERLTVLEGEILRVKWVIYFLEQALALQASCDAVAAASTARKAADVRVATLQTQLQQATQHQATVVAAELDTSKSLADAKTAWEATHPTPSE